MKLRSYQADAVSAVIAYWQQGGGNPVVEIPTGGGKSPILSAIATHIRREWNCRVLVVTHRAELVQQNANTIARMSPGERVGVWSASVGTKQRADIMSVQLQSIRADFDVSGVGLVIVDECHLVSADTSSMYGRLFSRVLAQNPDARIMGLSATPFRGNKMTPIVGDGCTFDSIVYRIGVRQLIDDGYLSPVVAGMPSRQVSADGIKIIAGEYSEREVAAKFDTQDVNDAACGDVAELLLSGARRSALLFGVNVDHAKHLRDGMRERGVVCGVVTGETSHHERARIVADFRAGRLSAIASCAVLTTGFDAPCTDVIAVVRAIAAPGLWVQIVGRGTRLCDGKTDCIVLDYGTNTARLGPIDDLKRRGVDGASAGGKKRCLGCDAENYNFATECKECGLPFPPSEAEDSDDDRHTTEASKLDVVSRRDQDGKLLTRWRVVDRVLSAHHKDGADRPTLRVDYWGAIDGKDSTPSLFASEFVCVEHSIGTYMARRAAAWWVSNANGASPTSVGQAIARRGDVRRLAYATTRKDGKYRAIVGLEFHEPMRQVGMFDEVR